MEKLENIVVLFHDRCFDGLAGAWVAHKKFGNTASYVAVSDHHSPPEGLEGKEIYVIDFSFRSPQIIELEKKVRRLVVLDHHKTAEEAVKSIREHVFDNNRSGAQIAWDYFFPNQERPKLVNYIGDSDIWTHKLPHTYEIGTYIHSHELTLESFDTLNEQLEDSKTFAKCVEIGSILNKAHKGRVESFAERAFDVSFEGYTVKALNCPSDLRSDVGHLLASQYPPFAILFYLDVIDGVPTWKISLRGDDTIDVAALAEKYGGGGHFSAAAFTTKDPDIIQTILQQKIPS